MKIRVNGPKNVKITRHSVGNHIIWSVAAPKNSLASRIVVAYAKNGNPENMWLKNGYSA